MKVNKVLKLSLIILIIILLSIISFAGIYVKDKRVYYYDFSKQIFRFLNGAVENDRAIYTFY